MQKTFVLDTNVLLHNADAINVFADNKVVLPIEVLEELDEFKKDTDEKGRNARHVIRTLDRLRRKGKLGKGVVLEGGGVLQIISDNDYKQFEHLGLNYSQADNRILFCAYALQKQGEKVVFVSKDINIRVKADAIGLRSMDFEKQTINFDEIYKGWVELVVEKSKINQLQASGSIDAPGNFIHNEFLLLKEAKNSEHAALAKYDANIKKAVRLKYSGAPIYDIKPRNIQQTMAIELLLDDSVNLVSLIGMAGTGKTFLALAVALAKVINSQAYSRILVSRPIMPLGRDIGYLPGTKEEKLESWMEPIFDNLEYLLYTSKEKSSESGVLSRKQKAKRIITINELKTSGMLELEALTYMRGRSIPMQYIIVDEAQNLTPHEIKTVVSRVGTGSKMVLTGDPYQIDNPYLDSSSNGLVYCVEKMKGQKLFGHVMFVKSERSNLASLAANIL
ncbi:MAG: phosphate starvation-inducible protein PhoH [Candidatus Omnitrophica bacterium CG_4_8_14_3_um_filter_43_15]|nr:MAG: phosphate starvation-inducible protein PhoH [Candidatus Omnitrophica bacterium CG03_land_8_20_14_0_80_43_22]PIW79755.1 MAG: phosphate starvation-inducible protein PhoH [Candidatus Omnitrophica bacterium CG_4_8_14_3_um_filter_43_15]